MLLAVFAAGLHAQAPSIATGGVLNDASYAKDSNGQGAPVAPGALVAIFGKFQGATMATAETVPLSVQALGSATVTFNGFPAPVDLVFPTGASPFITAQVPFEALPAGQTSAVVNVVVTVNGVASAPEQTNLIPQAPGVYTIPPTGQANAILVYTDPTDNVIKIAAPTTTTLGYPTAPIPRGTVAFFYASGLGAMTPPLADGYGGLEPPVVTHFANQTPTVLVGGITAQVIFAGQAPGYPGVSQINIVVPENAPTGNAVPLQVQSADGTVTSTALATIAVQ